MGWTRQEKLLAFFLALGIAIVAVLWIGIYAETKDCEAKGGKRLRGLLEGFTCYDLRTLKVLP